LPFFYLSSKACSAALQLATERAMATSNLALFCGQKRQVTRCFKSRSVGYLFEGQVRTAFAKNTQ
jgi:hypothetical protein